MQNQKLILLDFDVVIIDGINEYWYSSLLACRSYLESREIPNDLNLDQGISEIFMELRPYVKYGWEMVLITHEIIKKQDPLCNINKNIFIDNYKNTCTQTLKKNNWSSALLQESLDKSRKKQISTDLHKWIKRHKPFNEVLEFMKKAKDLGFKTGIISTKAKEFTTMILKNNNVIPDMIFGYQSGKKIDIIKNLSSEFNITCFIEDRKKTLTTILQDNQTRNIPCFLAEWGYLKKHDKINLPSKINLLKLKDLELLLAK